MRLVCYEEECCCKCYFLKYKNTAISKNPMFREYYCSVYMATDQETLTIDMGPTGFVPHGQCELFITSEDHEKLYPKEHVENANYIKSHGSEL